MKKPFLQTQTFPVLVMILLVSSCNGQAKTSASNASGNEPGKITAEHPKLIKTQGSRQSDNVRCGLQDKAGNLWFGTTGEGVYRYDGKSFTQFTKKDGLCSNSVWSILQDKTGNIWFGTTDGICRYDGKNIVGIAISGAFLPSIGNNDYYNKQSTKNTVWSMLQDKSGKIWFGTGDGVYCYNGSSFTRFLDNPSVINKQGLHLKMIDCMLEDKKGNIWFASGMPPGEEGICLYDGKSISSFKPNGDGWIRYITADKKGNIWFAGRQHGNFIYDGNKFTNFTEKAGLGNLILSDKSGNTWFTGEEDDNGITNKRGLWRYDGKNFQNFTEKDGMGNYFAWCMIEDSKGNIWIGTRNTGLYRFDGKSFTSFSE